MTYEVLIFPDGLSEISGRYYPRHVLAALAVQDYRFLNVVPEFSGATVTNLAQSLGTVTNLVLKPGGLYGTLKFHPQIQRIADDFLLNGCEFNPKVSAAYIGELESHNLKKIKSIERIIEVRLESWS